MSTATLAQRQAAEVQAQAQTASQRAHVNQAVASQRSNYDALDKTISRAPFDGLVTNVPVREGETMVVGIQNAEGSTLMTIADMSVITAEVKVDETDIVNVSLNQPADVTVDALPGRTFKGHVTQVGDQALLRTTGVATSQSTTGTEEAKDFKVVVTLDSPSDELRPGLSTTAKITTARRPNALTLPIQALVQRDPAEEKKLEDAAGKHSSTAASTTPPPNTKSQLVQGVYLVRNNAKKLRASFVPVKTGVTGATDIEVVSGLSDGQEIVVGPYKILRNLKSGTAVKVDNTPEVAAAAQLTPALHFALETVSPRPRTPTPSTWSRDRTWPPPSLPKSSIPPPPAPVPARARSSSPITSGRPTPWAIRRFTPSAASTSASATTSTSPSWVPPAPASPPS